MMPVNKTTFELYAEEGKGKIPAYLRSIRASRDRIAEQLSQLLKEGLRKNDKASVYEMAFRTQLYEADGAYSVASSLYEKDPKHLEGILRRTRRNLLIFELAGKESINWHIVSGAEECTEAEEGLSVQ
jgi:hypothetical protein